ncbi:MAG TPA: endo alpha-1,4 polygalactosaminidase [Actinomycetota bacterium]
MRRLLLCSVVLIGVIVPARAEAVATPITGGNTSAVVSVSSDRLAEPVECPGCWHPALRTSWQWQLQGPVDTSVAVEMYDIDGFEVSKATINQLHAAGRHVVCYISAGSWEAFRPDADDFPDSVLGRSNGWPGEKWLDVRKLGILGPIMETRLDMCARKGFDAVEFDNVDGYRNRTGFALDGSDQLRFNVFLANQAHERGLSAVLKNDLGQIRSLLPYYDFALNEQCHQYHECGRLDPFVDAGKAVFGVEYKLAKPDFCPQANAHGFNFLKKKLSLKVWRRPCRADP